MYMYIYSIGFLKTFCRYCYTRSIDKIHLLHCRMCGRSLMMKRWCHHAQIPRVCLQWSWKPCKLCSGPWAEDKFYVLWVKWNDVSFWKTGSCMKSSMCWKYRDFKDDNCYDFWLAVSHVIVYNMFFGSSPWAGIFKYSTLISSLSLPAPGLASMGWRISKGCCLQRSPPMENRPLLLMPQHLKLPAKACR